MSETLAASTKTPAAFNGTSDLQMLEQVEKWMAAIREIDREPQSETTFRVRLRPAQSAVTE
jgi:hypothetical protein